MPFPRVPIHSPSTFLPSFSIPNLPCPFCSSLIPIFVFSSHPSSFNLPVSLAIFPFRPSLSQPFHSLSISFLPSYLLPYLSTSPLPTYLLPYLSISLPTFPPSQSFHTHPFLLLLPLLLSFFSLFLFFSFPLSFHFSFPSPPIGSLISLTQSCRSPFTYRTSAFSKNEISLVLDLESW